MAVGIVTNTEIEDATPAAMVAHTRRRSTYDQIVEQLFAAGPKSSWAAARRISCRRVRPARAARTTSTISPEFRRRGLFDRHDCDRTDRRRQTGEAARPVRHRQHGRRTRPQIPQGRRRRKFPDQPDLTDQVRVALDVLSRHPGGFVLTVESGLIDKYTHALDMERAVYDTIMLDNAVKLARDWAAARGDDTLILVVADHNHPISLIGTIEDDMTQAPKAPLRERVGVYDKARFPNYPAVDKDGYPPHVDVSRRFAIFSASSPDYYETFRPKLDNPNEPTVTGTVPGTYQPNERYRAMPGAMLRLGDLPKYLNASVHSGEDVILTASGPGSVRVRGQIDNTEVFRIVAEALGSWTSTARLTHSAVLPIAVRAIVGALINVVPRNQRASRYCSERTPRLRGFPLWCGHIGWSGKAKHPITLH